MRETEENMKQITLEELGIIPKQIDRSRYATSCGGCICNHCANSVDCIDNVTGEAEFSCFNCDECFGFNGYGKDNWKPNCNQYKISNAYARYRRKQIRIVKR